MTINDLAREVHMNAVAHGWWDGERSNDEICALIHSEWSEALEEARAGRPLIWFACTAGDETMPCGPKDETDCMVYKDRMNCQYRSKKPEGIAVELIDGCIRILDYLGRNQCRITDKDSDLPSTAEDLFRDKNVADIPDDLAGLIASLHYMTAIAFINSDSILGANPVYLLGCITSSLCWVKKHGLDPLEVLMIKHEYNKTRPYKHGKKF